MKYYILILISALISAPTFAGSIYLKLHEDLTPLQKTCITSVEAIAATITPDGIVAAAGGAGDVNLHHTRTFMANVDAVRVLPNGVYKFLFPVDVSPLHTLTLKIKVTYPPCDAYMEGSDSLMAILSQANINEAMDSFSRKALVLEPAGEAGLAPAETLLKVGDMTDAEIAVAEGNILAFDLV